MVILGIDPGLRYTGWGIVKVEGTKMYYIASGVLKQSAKYTNSVRLFKIYDGLKKVINKFMPNIVALEETFVNKDKKGALQLGHARGIALMVPAIFNLDIYEYAPNTIKKSVVGHGHATKDEVTRMIQIIFPNIKELNADAIDAIAIALCHGYHAKYN